MVSFQAVSRDGLTGYSGHGVIFRIHAWSLCTCIVFTAAGLQMVDILNIIHRVSVPC